MNAIIITSILFMHCFNIPDISIADRYSIYHRAQVREILSFNLAIQEQIRRHHWFYPDRCRNELAELKRLHRIWDAVDDCLSDIPEKRMLGLLTLQREIGRQDMLDMNLPCPITR